MTANPADAVREALDASEAAMVLRTLANNAGTPRIAKALNECADVIAALTARVAEQTAQLAKCFKLAGADCDGDEDWRIAPGAVQAVTDLRRDYEEAGNEIEELMKQAEAHARDAGRLAKLRARAKQSTAYDVYGNGGHWSVGFHSADNRLSFDEALDAMQEPQP